MKCFKKVLSFTTAVTMLIGFTMSVTSCGTAKESSDSDSKKETKISTSKEIEKEVTTKQETYKNKAAKEASTEETITNLQWLSMINEAFGMKMDPSDDDLEIAKSWGVIGENEKIDIDAPIDNKFAIETLMRTTGFVDESATYDEIVKCAIEKKIIKKDTDLSDSQNALDALEAAVDAWSHQSFESEDNIQFADGVQDFRELIDADSVKINDSGNSVTIPSEFADKLSADTVYILPPDDEYPEGRAMKAVSVTDNKDGTSTVKSVPAEINEIYSDLNFSGEFTPDFEDIEILDDNVQVKIGD